MIKRILLGLLFLCWFVGYSQDEQTMRIIEKLQSGKELTKAEKDKLDQWTRDMEKQMNEHGFGIDANQKDNVEKQKFTAPVKLTKVTYIELCKSLLPIYSEKIGYDVHQLDYVLSTSTKPTDGSDMGAGLLMAGSASASVYSIATSAIKKPDDIITASNLGVALLNNKDNTKALQVLLYANNLKPNIGLIHSNLGWAYLELGSLDNAKKAFNTALTLASEMTSPYLGLGIIAAKEGDNIAASNYLKKALKDKYSNIGMIAYKQSKQSNDSKSSSDESLSDKKDNPEGLKIPELPSSESVEHMASQVSSLESYAASLAQKSQVASEEYKSILATVGKYSSNEDGNSVTLQRDFSKESMTIDDFKEMLFGNNSKYQRDLKRAGTYIEQANKSCEPVGEQMVKALESMNEQAYCKLNKQLQEILFVGEAKYYSVMLKSFRESAMEYYSYTDPLLSGVYSPNYNKLFNKERELFILMQEKIVADYAVMVSKHAETIGQMNCDQQPSDISQSGIIPEENLPDKNADDCPLGKDGISGGMGALSFELSCQHVKLSGGEGVLWSVKREFATRETTIWGGVGAKAEFGNGNLTGEASVGVEITIGEGDQVKDVAFTSSVKAGLGGLVESEVSGRFAVEAGPSIEANAGFTMPDIPGL